MKDSDLISVLVDMKTASKLDPEKAIKKFDSLFLGAEMNVIYTTELRHCLKRTFNIEISKEELLKLVKHVCAGLGMHLEPLREVNNKH